ncbi:MAG: DNA alkylation repair protein [Flammeovirgaceae bacterium]|nr:DNA alkylation repair protein [Flammeovirgaceae bacterium]
MYNRQKRLVYSRVLPKAGHARGQARADLIQKAVGSWIREAGKKDKLVLLDFLDSHATTMPRTMLRYSIENLSKKEKDYYLKSKGK